MGVIAGQKLFTHKSSQAQRDEVIRKLNAGDLHGMIMTDRFSRCGHNLVGANHIIFMGSLYSQSYEDQYVGTWIVCLQLIEGRMCTQGQTRVPHAWIIADPNFVGDSVSINIKQSRGEAEELLRKKMTAGEYEAYEDPEVLLVNSEKYMMRGDSRSEPIVV
jgi:hypothetical protein